MIYNSDINIILPSRNSATQNILKLNPMFKNMKIIDPITKEDSLVFPMQSKQDVVYYVILMFWLNSPIIEYLFEERMIQASYKVGWIKGTTQADFKKAMDDKEFSDKITFACEKTRDMIYRFLIYQEYLPFTVITGLHIAQFQNTKELIKPHDKEKDIKNAIALQKHQLTIVPSINSSYNEVIKKKIAVYESFKDLYEYKQKFIKDERRELHKEENHNGEREKGYESQGEGNNGESQEEERKEFPNFTGFNFEE